MSEQVEAGVEAGVPRRPQDLVDGCVLLLLAERRGHGYELHERFCALLPAWTVTPGTLYRALRRLEASRLVLSVQEATQIRGPARRVYEITARGHAALDGWALETRHVVDTLDGCLATAPAAAAPSRPHGRRRSSFSATW